MKLTPAFFVLLASAGLRRDSTRGPADRLERARRRRRNCEQARLCWATIRAARWECSGRDPTR